MGCSWLMRAYYLSIIYILTIIISIINIICIYFFNSTICLLQTILYNIQSINQLSRI